MDLGPRGAGSWVYTELGQILLRTPKSVIDDGGAQYIMWEQSSPIRLVFWVEVRPKAWVCCELRWTWARGAPTHGL